MGSKAERGREWEKMVPLICQVQMGNGLAVQASGLEMYRQITGAIRKPKPRIRTLINMG